MCLNIVDIFSDISFGVWNFSIGIELAYINKHVNFHVASKVLLEKRFAHIEKLDNLFRYSLIC